MRKIYYLILLALVSFNWVSAQEKINWIDIKQALNNNQQEPRKIIVDVYTDWCGWCKVMDRTTYSDTNIVNYINKTYYAVKFNAEQKEDIVLGDKTYKFVSNGSRGYHELAAALLSGNMGYPSTVIINEKNEIIQVKQGYIKAKQFDEMINFFGGNYHITSNYNEFLKNYSSPVPEI